MSETHPDYMIFSSFHCDWQVSHLTTIKSFLISKKAVDYQIVNCSESFFGA